MDQNDLLPDAGFILALDYMRFILNVNSVKIKR